MLRISAMRCVRRPAARAGPLGDCVDTVGLFREALAEAHGSLERTVAGLDPAGWARLRFLAAHCDQITGEIACLKGLQGRGEYG